jgi:hypothetical protein
VARDERGRVLPGGGSLNPGGVPVAVLALRKRLAMGAEGAVDELLALMRDPDARVRLAACRDVLDRVLGRPVPTEPEEDESSRKLQDLLVALTTSTMVME